MKHTGPLLVLMAFTGVCFAGTVSAEDCETAKAMYKHGTTLLNYHERCEAFQKAVDLCPSYAEARVNLADALENLALLKTEFDQEKLTRSNDLLDQAEREYKKALELNKDLLPARLGLAQIYLCRGSYPLAEEEYNQALALQRYNETARDGLSKVKELIAAESAGVRKSEKIVQEARESSLESRIVTMGIENFTVKARQRFDNILFEGWSAQIQPGQPSEQLNEIGKALSSPHLATFQFVIEGHTNNVGERDRNRKLSWDRAAAVKTSLVKNFNIAPGRLLTQGFGYERPLFPNDTHENRARNRRVEILFLNRIGEK